MTDGQALQAPHAFHPDSDSAPGPIADNLSRNTRSTTLSDQERNSDSSCPLRFLGSALRRNERSSFFPWIPFSRVKSSDFVIRCSESFISILCFTCFVSITKYARNTAQSRYPRVGWQHFFYLGPQTGSSMAYRNT